MKILAIDDEVINLGLLKEILVPIGYEVTVVESAGEGLTLLQNKPEDYDIILLDRMLPGMDGMTFLAEIRKNPVLQEKPVIMQTAAASTQQLIEGLEAGAYYYLTKPFDQKTLKAIVDSAAEMVLRQQHLHEELERDFFVFDMIESATFTLRTPEEAKKLAVYLGRLCSDPHRASYAFSELLMNAIEHGVLELGYEKKEELLTEGHGRLKEEIESRLKDPKRASRHVTVIHEREPGKISVTIKDDGPGFNWKSYLDFDPVRALTSNGRGVALANLNLGELKYNKEGNEVRCEITV